MQQTQIFFLFGTFNGKYFVLCLRPRPSRMFETYLNHRTVYDWVYIELTNIEGCMAKCFDKDSFFYTTIILENTFRFIPNPF